jgi:electron transfer flavoprotein beta subunit
MMGVDECALLSDKALAGSDVLATSYALSGAIQRMGEFDLIVCGKQTTDGDTAQVGAEIAEFLDLPHVSNVTRILHVKDRVIRVEMDMSDYAQIQDIPFPCLITVEKDIYMPRLPSYRRRQESQGKEIPVFTLGDLEDSDPLHYGLNGSPTQVERVFPPPSSGERIVVEGSPVEMADRLFQILKESKFI